MARKRKQRRKKGARRSVKWLLRRIGWIATLLVVLSILLVLPLRWVNPPTSAFMLRDTHDTVQYEWTDREQIADVMLLAVVAAEDQRFADHFGVDVQSIRQSLDDAGDGGRLRGASTITQQLAKNLFLSPSRSFLRKGVEAYFSVLLEVCLPKRRILEIYVNIVELGPGVYGATAASRHFFNKSPQALNRYEAALLAAVLPNPARLRADHPTPYLRKRQRWIMEHMTRLQRERWITRID